MARPTAESFARLNRGFEAAVLIQGLEAMQWIADERGLGGRRSLDGLSWRLPAAEVWEAWVGHLAAVLSRRLGARLLRPGEARRPIAWTGPVRSLGHLAPDAGLELGEQTIWLDAKYKRHVDLLRLRRWRDLGDEVRDAHRADVHQALAYTAVSRTPAVTTMLVYPVGESDEPVVSSAHVAAGERRVRLVLAGVPFGFRTPAAEAVALGLLWALPGRDPAAVALLDVRERGIETFIGDEVSSVSERLAAFEIIGAMDVRGLLRRLEFEPGKRRIEELGPPQKTKKLNNRGRTLKITPELLIQGSCGISKPFGDLDRLEGYLRDEQDGKLRRRLEANVKSLFALYQYGRLHGSLRLRWGFLDERVSAPWVHFDEPALHRLKKAALEVGSPLEVVVGSAPGWAEPWARARQVFVRADQRGWGSYLIDERELVVDEDEIQLARLSSSG